MSIFEFLNHLVGLVVPAVFVAVFLALGARWVWRKKTHLLPWYQMAVVNMLLGVVVLALGLVLTGQDGRMGTYAALVVALSSSQWLMSGGWRAG